MDKKILLIVAAVLVVLGGAGGFLIISNRSTTPQAQPNTQTETTQDQIINAKEQKSLKDLLSLGQTQECTFDDSEGNKGSVYIGNNKMRGDFTSSNNDEQIKAHIIVDDKTSYVWMDGQNTGFKMAVDPASQGGTDNSQNQLDLDKKVDYNCKSWTINPSLFTLPSSVKFSDLSSFAVPSKTTSKNTTEDKPKSDDDSLISSQCAACENLEGAAKSQCKVALKCN